MSSPTATEEINTTDQPAIPTITCGCGFSVSGYDEDTNRAAHADHECSAVPAAAPTPWHESVFSLWGMVIAVAIVFGVIEVLGLLR